MNPFTEPIGYVKPQVSSKVIEIKTVGTGSVFVGICPGQAFPVPVFRSVGYRLEDDFKRTTEFNLFLSFSDNGEGRRRFYRIHERCIQGD